MNRRTSDTRCSERIARWVATITAALLGLVTAGPGVAQTPVSPVVVSKYMHGEQAPVIDARYEFDYVLQPLPDEITVRTTAPYGYREERFALLGNIETRPAAFSGDFAEAEGARRDGGGFLTLIIAVVTVLAAAASGYYILISMPGRSVNLLVAGAIYLISAGLIVYNMTRQFGPRLERYYGASYLEDAYWVTETGSAVILMLLGIVMIWASLGRYYAGPRWATWLGLASVAGAGYVLVTGFLRVERTIIVDNATDAPYRVTVDGVDLGMLPALGHASFILSRGSPLQQPSDSVSVSLRAEQGAAEQNLLIALTGPLNQLIVNVDNRNAYRVEKELYGSGPQPGGLGLR